MKKLFVVFLLLVTAATAATTNRTVGMDGTGALSGFSTNLFTANISLLATANVSAGFLLSTGNGSNLTGVVASTSSNVLWAADLLDPTGFVNSGAGWFTTNSQVGGVFLLTYTNSTPMKFYMNGVLSNISYITASIPTNRAVWFVSIPNGSNTVRVSSNSWSLSDAQIATVFTSTNVAPILVRETHGLMPQSVHARFHLDASLAAARISGYNISTNGNGISMTTGSFFDEDLIHTSADGITSVYIAWRDGASGWMEYRGPRAECYITNAATSLMRYDNNGSFQDIQNNNYGVMWFYCFPHANTNTQIVAVLGQAEYATLAAAQSAVPVSLQPGFATAEAVLLFAGIWQSKNNQLPIWKEFVDYRFSKINGSTTPNGASGTASNATITVVNGIVIATTSNPQPLTNNYGSTITATAFAGSGAALTGITPLWRFSFGPELVSYGSTNELVPIGLIGSTTIFNVTELDAGDSSSLYADGIIPFPAMLNFSASATVTAAVEVGMITASNGNVVGTLFVQSSVTNTLFNPTITTLAHSITQAVASTAQNVFRLTWVLPVTNTEFQTGSTSLFRIRLDGADGGDTAVSNRWIRCGGFWQ